MAKIIFICLFLVAVSIIIFATLKTKQLNDKTTSQERTNMTATITTNLGSMTFDLFADEAPKTVENFTTLAKKKYYNGIIFHRVIEDFMIQGGDPTGTGSGGKSIFGKNFADEFNSHKVIAGALAMANRGPNTNGSQFFIVTKSAQPHLDGRHTVFGQIREGQETLAAIAATPVDASDRPIKPVTIEKIVIN